MRKEDILFDIIFDKYGITRVDLTEQNRVRRLVDIRRVLAYILRDKLKYGVELCGEILGRDHASIVYMNKTHDSLVKGDNDYKALYDEIYSEFYYRVNHVKYEPNIEETLELLLIDNNKIREQIIKLKRLIGEKK